MRRGGELGVEAAIPVHVRAEARRHAVGEHLDDAAERVAVFVGAIDLGDHERADVAGSKQRSGSASSASTSSGVGSGDPSGTRTVPIESVWVTRRMPSSPRNARATAPSATRAAVSRALARSSTLRASSKSYFCMPTRSA